MKSLNLQIRTNDRWRNIGVVSLLESESLGLSAKTEFSYDMDYVTEFADRNDYRAVSCLVPVAFEPVIFQGWPPFLLDLFPQGAALQYIIEHHRVLDRPEYYWKILNVARLNPPGNMRVMNGPEEPAMSVHSGFTKAEVLNKGADFLKYMIECGAPVAGSTGAAGAAPKFLLREDHQGRFFADGALPDDKTANCWMVKFPRGSHASDKEILRSEKAYYDIARAVGLNTSTPLTWEEDCLFINRFDRVIRESQIGYLGMESFYSMVGLPEFGSRLDHETYLAALSKFSSEPDSDIIEYCLRDLLNSMMGNTDNHAYNHSLLKEPGWTRLAPLYDFAPMKFDREGIARNTRWNALIDSDGVEPLTRLLVERFQIEKGQWMSALRAFGAKTQGLEALMHSHNVTPEFIVGTRDDRRRLQKSINDVCGLNE